MSHVGTRGSDVFVRDPAHARLVADTLADAAAAKYPRRKAYQVLRSLTPAELYEMLEASRDGNDAFRRAFGPVYHRYVGEVEAGPLFEEDNDE